MFSGQDCSREGSLTCQQLLPQGISGLEVKSERPVICRVFDKEAIATPKSDTGMPCQAGLRPTT
jgi:hypothetical protein